MVNRNFQLYWPEEIDRLDPSMSSILLRWKRQLESRIGEIQEGRRTSAIAFGSLSVKDGSTAQTGITTSPEIVTLWDTAGNTRNVKASTDDNELTALVSGQYLMLCQVSISGASNVQYSFRLRINDVEKDTGFSLELTGTGLVSGSFVDDLRVEAGDRASIYVETDQAGGDDMTMVDGQFTLAALGL